MTFDPGVRFTCLLRALGKAVPLGYADLSAARTYGVGMTDADALEMVISETIACRAPGCDRVLAAARSFLTAKAVFRFLVPG